ncbi:helix-turn-helix domain-containing protein [Pseudonocardia parietis]|uniref:AraC-like DNA-binding protein n=1 Tax=Pseudonocardia parietis TaxID=570936 RepID=A0ABS4W4R2_9PSEU|nr:helix-turn-helix domain-containing protein [Pseudonocardia parietis]MBP2371212.1 AraC-like DNA-binding protein [Pseudonocardia parietis]
MLLLDSRNLPEPERAGTVASRMAEASRAAVTLAPHERPWARMDLWQLGRLQLFRTASSGIAMSRSERETHRHETPIVALAVQQHGTARHEQFGHRHEIATDGLMLVDLSEPFAFSWGTRGASRALQIPVDELALPADVVRSASTRLATGPLTRLVTQHIIDLFREADRIAGGPQAAMVGDVSIDLVRALLSSAAADGRSATRDVLHDTLLARVREFVRQNLRHPELGPRMIADAHNVSVRHLYERCAGAGISLEQLIITRRLQGARDALGRPDSSHRTIETIAHEWGFRDATHFGRRFRAAYGTTPGEHRARAAAPAGRIRARRE